MRSDIHQRIKKYPYYQLIFRWRHRGQELRIYWPVISPVAIIHVDFWIPGKYTDSKLNMELMNDICDMSQFVVVIPVTNESSAILADNLSNRCL